jgi:hypothetical protein
MKNILITFITIFIAIGVIAKLTTQRPESLGELLGVLWQIYMFMQSVIAATGCLIGIGLVIGYVIQRVAL